MGWRRRSLPARTADKQEEPAGGWLDTGSGMADDGDAFPQRVAREQAVQSVDEWSRTIVARALHGRRRPVSAELVYLPWWLYGYRLAIARQPPRMGRIAIESRGNTVASVPDSVRLEPKSTAARVLPLGANADLSEARRTLWFELLGRTRRRAAFELTIESTTLVSVPYWVVYTRGRRRIEILPVDATNGKIDLALREPILDALIEARNAPGTTDSPTSARSRPSPASRP